MSNQEAQDHVEETTAEEPVAKQSQHIERGTRVYLGPVARARLHHSSPEAFHAVTSRHDPYVVFEGHDSHRIMFSVPGIVTDGAGFERLIGISDPGLIFDCSSETFAPLFYTLDPKAPVDPGTLEAWYWRELILRKQSEAKAA